jgi:peptidoglycan/LPS O-acetylase OafA/YrhL
MTPSIIFLAAAKGSAQAANANELFPWVTFVQCFPLLRLPEFLIGVLAGVSFARRTDPLSGGGFLAAGSALAVLVAMALVPQEMETVSGNGFLAPLFVLLIWNLARSGGLLGIVLSWRPILFLGDVSYSVYILQEPFCRWFQAITGREARFTFYAYVAGLLALSVACFLFVEKRGGRWITNTLRRHQQPYRFAAQLAPERT